MNDFSKEKFIKGSQMRYFFTLVAIIFITSCEPTEMDCSSYKNFKKSLKTVSSEVPELQKSEFDWAVPYIKRYRAHVFSQSNFPTVEEQQRILQTFDGLTYKEIIAFGYSLEGENHTRRWNVLKGKIKAYEGKESKIALMEK